ncbi:hypothetical protein [Pseudomonas huaxiensis]|uniref:hypothetical protein n=1 Tax=Pseudomonas huaxiensis TaxID=2213017 RepID=UPI000DA685A9|nr:hypothetical protein [Pseudomonas huaxiensis]
MQAQHYTLLAAVAWIFTMAFLPFLFAKARQRAYEKGYAEGLDKLDAMNWQRLQALDSTLAERAVDREKEQRQHLQTKAALLGTITELENRIAAYTGLAVTADDHRLVTQAADTLQLAQRTWNAVKGTGNWGARAEAEATGLLRLAELIHAQVRRSPAAAKAGSAA